MVCLQFVGINPDKTGCWLRYEVINKMLLLQVSDNSIPPLFVFNRPYAYATLRLQSTFYRPTNKEAEGAVCGIYSRRPQVQNKWTIDKCVSVIQVKLTGITTASKDIVRREMTDKTVKICTDDWRYVTTKYHQDEILASVRRCCPDHVQNWQQDSLQIAKKGS